MTTPVDLDAIAESFQGYLSGTTEAPSGPDMLASIRNILNNMPRPVLVCHPDDEERLSAALAQLPFPVPVPELQTNPLLLPGQAYYIADARPFFDREPEAMREAASRLLTAANEAEAGR